MKKLIINFFIVVLAINTATLHANAKEEKFISFKNIFTNWTHAFNQKDLRSSCELFSKTVIADYQGFKSRNYHQICSEFKKIFSQTNRRYQYDFKLHQVYQSEELAAARITWYFHIYENNKLIESTQDEGLDVFKNENGKWKIVNYLAYQQPK